jgi:hypothetical protein
MQIYALNGYLYSIEPRLKPALADYVVQFPYHANWTPRRAEALSATIRSPCILIGFSDGADAAARIAKSNPNVKALFFHSGLDNGLTIPGSIDFVAYRTTGDRTPTYRQTERFFYRQWGGVMVQLVPDAFDNPTRFEKTFLKPLNHQFHNAIPHLVKTVKEIVEKWS